MSEAGTPNPAPSVQVLKLSMQDYQSVVDATLTRSLTALEHGHLQALLDTTAALQQAMQRKWEGGPVVVSTTLIATLRSRRRGRNPPRY